MAKNDFARLKHMLDAAQACMEFTAKRKRKDFERDKILSFAVIRALEIFGEAAANLSKSFQMKYPHIQWRAIVGMRNRLIHAYFDVDYDIVWSAVTIEIPSIIPQLQEILSNTDVTNIVDHR